LLAEYLGADQGEVMGIKVGNANVTRIGGFWYRRLTFYGDRKIRDGLGLGGGGGLLVTRERLDALAEIQIKLIDGDAAVLGIVGGPVETLHQSLGEGPIAPFGVFQ
jgi:hypothetical protein